VPAMSRRHQWNPRNSGGDTFFGGNGLFFGFGFPLLTVFKSFIPFGNFFTYKTRLSDASKQRCNIGDG
jgi:hypothetical protein